jgi:hypothetical protein
MCQVTIMKKKKTYSEAIQHALMLPRHMVADIVAVISNIATISRFMLQVTKTLSNLTAEFLTAELEIIYIYIYVCIYIHI